MVENTPNNEDQLKGNNFIINGCLLLVLSPFILFFLVLLILSIIAIPAFWEVSSEAKASAVKNSLLTGIRKCLDRKTNNETDLTWNSVQTFSKANTFSGYKIQAIDQNSCFNAKALPLDNKNTWFEAELDQETKEISKRCVDSSKPGCDEGNTW